MEKEYVAGLRHEAARISVPARYNPPDPLPARRVDDGNRSKTANLINYSRPPKILWRRLHLACITRLPWASDIVWL